jgi:hypothetical protein
MFDEANAVSLSLKKRVKGSVIIIVITERTVEIRDDSYYPHAIRISLNIILVHSFSSPRVADNPSLLLDCVGILVTSDQRCNVVVDELGTTSQKSMFKTPLDVTPQNLTIGIHDT